MELPWDFSKNNRKNAGTSCRTVIGGEAKERLKRLGENNHTSLFMVLFSAYVILLSRLSDRQDQDIACLVISSSRDHIQLQTIVGFFVNSVMVKIRVESEDTFTDLLHRVEDETLEALRHQDYPLERVCEELKIKYPEIPTAFNMLNLPNAPVEAGADNEAIEGNIQDALFHLEPYVIEYKNSIQITWRYRETLFKPETVEYIAQGYMLLLEEISWMEEEEK